MSPSLIPTELPLGGFQSSIADAEFIVFGNPLDETASFRSGCNLGPENIREFAANIETINPYTRTDLAEVFVHDLGNLQGDRAQLLNHTEQLFRKYKDKQVLMLGGEHTITVGSRYQFSDCLYVVFDAHLDLRNEYNGDPLSHAAAIRRVMDVVPPEQIIFVGTRAISLEEKVFIEKHPEISIHWAHKWDESDALKEIHDKVESYRGLYLSVDMDGFDPGFVPGVGNPEAIGLTPREFFSFLHQLPQVLAADINELNPRFDTSGASSTVAARLALAILTMDQSK